MRRLPKDEHGNYIVPPKVRSHFSEKMVECVRNYKLITPLFGGGVISAEADPVTLIRGSAIRGHLRFWWRACRGGKFKGDLKKMKKAEDDLWGTAVSRKKGVPSLIQISVNAKIDNSNKRKDRIRPPTFSYVAFPLQKESYKVMDGVFFELIISYPKDNTRGIKVRKEIEAALWAWETFGGVGGRTRRGFGALQRLEEPALPADCKQIKEKIEADLRQHVVKEGKWPKNVPHLQRNGQDLRVTDGFPDPLQAWEYLISKLKGFRQCRKNEYGPSLWPEAEEINRLHKENKTQNKAKFPRAQFGLPIEFHFGKDDSRNTSLEGQIFKRRASPLILRPLACCQGQGAGLALVLGCRQLPPGGLVLKGKAPPPDLTAELTKEEAEKIAPLKGNPDVLDAFLKTFD